MIPESENGTSPALWKWFRTLRFFGLFLLIFAGCITSLQADEAILPDGTLVAGKLTMDDGGSLLFVAKDAKIHSLAKLHLCRFPGHMGTWSPWPEGARQLVLPGKQRVAGRLHAIGADHVSFQPCWAEKPIKIQRGPIEAITQLSGWRTLVEDAFQAPAKAWQFNIPRAYPEPGEAVPAMALKERNQKMTWRLSKPLEQGRFSIAYRLPDAGTSKEMARWTIQPAFQEMGKTVDVAVQIGEGGRCSIRRAGKWTASADIEKPADWNYLECQFSRLSIRFSLNGKPIWYDFETWPAGQLTELVLQCVEAKDGNSGKAPRLVLSQLRLAAGTDEPPRPAGDTTQDEIWLATGDQVFGNVVSANPQSVTLRSSAKNWLCPWPEIHGIYFREAKAPADILPAGPRVRLWLDSGLGSVHDELQGVVSKLDETTLVLKHGILGDLRIDRRRLLRLRPMP